MSPRKPKVATASAASAASAGEESPQTAESHEDAEKERFDTLEKEILATEIVEAEIAKHLAETNEHLKALWRRVAWLEVEVRNAERRLTNRISDESTSIRRELRNELYPIATSVGDLDVAVATAQTSLDDVTVRAIPTLTKRVGDLESDLRDEQRILADVTTNDLPLLVQNVADRKQEITDLAARTDGLEQGIQREDLLETLPDPRVFTETEAFAANVDALAHDATLHAKTRAQLDEIHQLAVDHLDHLNDPTEAAHHDELIGEWTARLLELMGVNQ
jgi:hypothetical protein